MKIPPIDSVESQNKTDVGDPITSFILGYEDSSDGSVINLKFEVTPRGIISIYHAAWREDTMEIGVDPINYNTITPEDFDLTGELTVTLEEGARISDMDLARDPKSGKHYLAVMVDLALDWPAEANRSSSESMTVNQ